MDISVVIPVYACEPCLLELNKRLCKVLDSTGFSYEIVYIDDRSRDTSWMTLKKMALTCPQVRAFRLSRNFGQQAAITAGLSKAKGQRVIVMDCDLQDPPEAIIDLIQKADEGFAVVLAKRVKKKHSFFRRMAARFYFGILNSVISGRYDGDFGSFSLVERKVVDAYLQVQDRDRHYMFVLNWLGFKTGFIEYIHQDRLEGKSSYTLKMLVQHAVQGLFFQTTTLLKAIVYTGIVVSCIGFLMSGVFVYNFFINPVYPGWTSLIVITFLLGGFSIVSIGITGLYVGKIFEQVKGRPLFFIDEGVGDMIELENERA